MEDACAMTARMSQDTTKTRVSRMPADRWRSTAAIAVNTRKAPGARHSLESGSGTVLRGWRQMPRAAYREALSGRLREPPLADPR